MQMIYFVDGSRIKVDITEIDEKVIELMVENDMKGANKNG